PGELRQMRDAPGRAQALEVPAAHDRDAGRVVTAVLELAYALDQDIDYVVTGGCADDAAHGWLYFFFCGRFQRRDCCLTRERVSMSAGASRVMVLPAPIVAPRRTVTGATSCVSEPMKTSSSITVWCLAAPS